MKNIDFSDIFVWLNENSKSPHWKLRFCSDESEIVHEIPVGVIVYYILNQVNRIKDDKTIDLSKYIDVLDANIKHSPCQKEKWFPYYNKLIELIDNKSEMSFEEKANAYKIYNQFAFFLLNDLDFDKWVDYVKDKKSAIISNPDYRAYDVVKWCGNFCDEKGTEYINCWVAGFEYLFIIDLWELLYNKNVKIQMKKCKYCDDYFFCPTTKQRKYCYDCSEPKKRNKIRNQERKKDAAQYRCKLVCDILFKRIDKYKDKGDKAAEELAFKAYQDFLDENQYHKDRLLNNSEYNPDYPDIKTAEEYLQWLREYHEQIKIRKGTKHGETNETCEWNRSNHEGIGQTQEALSSDDHPWME